MGETSWRPGNETALQGGHPCRQGKETAAKIAALQFLPAIGSPQLICSSYYVLRSNRATAGATRSRRWVQRDS